LCLNESKKSGGILFQKTTSTCIERFGVENPFQSNTIKEKCKKTLKKNYGENVVNPSQVKEIREKTVSTWIKNYGVDNPMKCEKVKTKVRVVLLEKYGVQNSFSLSHIRGTAVRSLENENIRKIAQEAKRAAGKVFVSKLENLFIERLVKLFGEKEVLKQTYLGGKSIDAFISKCDLFIQFDGSHFHGLNEKSLVYENVRTKVINDRIQDIWFFDNKVKLLRISDKVAKIISDEDLCELITFASRNEEDVTYAFGDAKIPVL
jgi:hypothetical protein